MKKIFVINGPSINFTGIREKDIYGNFTYTDLENEIKKYCKDNNVKVKIEQSNCEGIIIDLIQEAYLDGFNGIVLNAGAYTHYSYAIKDAIRSVDIPVVEVHLSNTLAREDFRKTNVIREDCINTFEGEKFTSYIKAINFLINYDE